MKTHNEKLMREEKSPHPQSIEDLARYIDAQSEGQHDYGTCVYAMSLSAVAAFNFVAHKLGVTGFQASCADLDVLRRLRHMDGPFMLVKAEDALYPQYDLHEKMEEALRDWSGWLKEAALKKLEESGTAHPDVLAHWANLAYPDGGDKWLAVIAKAKFLRNDFNEAFIESHLPEFKEFGINEVYLSRDEGDVSKAESCKDGSMFRISLPVSLSFERTIGHVRVTWSVDTERKGSNGADELHIDFDKLRTLEATAQKAEVKTAITDYIKRCEAVADQSEKRPSYPLESNRS